MRIRTAKPLKTSKKKKKFDFSLTEEKCGTNFIMIIEFIKIEIPNRLLPQCFQTSFLVQSTLTVIRSLVAPHDSLKRSKSRKSNNRWYSWP